jgi:hypothetical protein
VKTPTIGTRNFAAWLRRSSLLLAVLGLLVAAGCRTCPRAGRPPDPAFQFGIDTFSFPNELKWEYATDPTTGRTVTRRHEPPPEYSLHCVVLARSARQFYLNARFDPTLPQAEPSTYRRKVREIVASNPRCPVAASRRVIIPGFPDLHKFSVVHDDLLKETCGGAWQSYVQRGNWRMIFPFSRRHQEKTATGLLKSIQGQWPVVVHLVRFPALTINHAILVYAAHESDVTIEFTAYDPNDPTAPVALIYDRRRRSFTFPSTPYFAGGRLDVYEIYSGILN